MQGKNIIAVIESGLPIGIVTIIQWIAQYGFAAVEAVLGELITHNLTGLTFVQILKWVELAILAYITNPTNPNWPPFPTPA